jgi:glutathione S-transferase
MTDITFYTNPQSRGRIVRWMLEECGADYQTKVVGYGPEMKSEPYLSINPMGKVPALVYDGKIVTECSAIIAFLAEKFPAAGLLPPPEARHDYYRWMFFTAGPFEAALTNKSLGFVVPDDKQGFTGYGSFETVVNALARAVSAKPFIAGENFSAADVYVGSHIGLGLQFGSLPNRPEFTEYFARVSERPARQKANTLDDALAKAAA